MKIKQKIIQACLVLCLFTGLTVFMAPFTSAQEVDCTEKSAQSAAECCGGAKTSIIRCGEVAGTGTRDNGVWALLLLTLNIMTAGIGILAVGGIAYGAALYASSGDKPEQAKQGKEFIKNVVIGLIAYGLMFLILNFLIPGGIFSGDTSGSNPQPNPPMAQPGQPVFE